MTRTDKDARRRNRQAKSAARGSSGDDVIYPVVCGPDTYEDGRDMAVKELQRLGSGRLTGAVTIRTYVGATQAIGVLLQLRGYGSAGAAYDKLIAQAAAMGDVAVLHLASARRRG